jgi:prepilin-type N-terminal cleavage/methylation domain-containing protein
MTAPFLPSPTPKHLRRARAGFSLVELVAAMAIFSMGVMACLELYSASLRTTTDAVLYTQAVFLAQGLMEETLADGYLIAGSDSGDFGTNYPDHTYEMEIEETEQTGLTQVTLVVQWTVRGKEKNYTLVSLCADRDIVEPVS